MLHFAVFGNPIAQSKSPFIHTMFGVQAGLDIDYTAILVPEGKFVQAAIDFFAKPQHLGLNITVPFKEDAFRFADRLTPHAAAAGAVNTLYKTEQGIIGHNTDGLGLVQDLLSQGVTLAGQRVLLIGAGGAARGVLAPLFDQDIKSLHIVNRNIKRAKELLSIVPDVAISASGFQQIPDDEYDIVINATTLSLQAAVPDINPVLLGKAKCVYDMVYLSQPTAFMATATEAGCTAVIDGLGMLVGQAAESFTFWTGLPVSTKPVAQALRENLRKAV